LLIAGANRHAIELVDILVENNITGFVFYDDINLSTNKFLNQYPIIHSIEEAKNYFQSNSMEFALGVGSPKARKLLSFKLESAGGKLVTITSNSAKCGSLEICLGDGLNLMHYTLISSRVKIGKGTLINAYASVHHDVVIGDFCEVAPHCAILGGVVIGNQCSLGANCTILPNIVIGDNVIIGAGAVVTKDLESNTLAAGVPAKILGELPPLPIKTN
jgi:sugar O-acyltransferase (sialic acid O-acetyltransferase NeuD family)